MAPPGSEEVSLPGRSLERLSCPRGEIRRADGVLLTRPSHVVVDPAGDLAATVRRLIPLEDGARVELELDLAQGQVSAVVPFPVPHVGDEVRLRVVGGARFPASAFTEAVDKPPR